MRGWGYNKQLPGPYVPEQDFLLPPSLRQWLPENRLAYFVSEMIDQLDLSGIESYYEREERGYPHYHPGMMTKVLVYGYCVGVFSSRKLEKWLVEDVAFRVPAAGSQEISSLIGVKSPFSRVLFVGYDRPTSGAVLCARGAECYRFEMVAMDVEGKYDRAAWDRGQEVRIFTLARLPLYAFQKLDQILAKPGCLQSLATDEVF